MTRIAQLSVICTALLLLSSASTQTTSEYDALIQKGRSQLETRTADLALASGESTIRMNADRWEGYALAGGALMNLKRYQEAADNFSKAIDRAPEAKQAALRDLRKQCLLADSAGPPAAKESTPTATTTQAEIVLWKSIENSTSMDDFRAYLEKYPGGTFSTVAVKRIETFERKAREDQATRAHVAGLYKLKSRTWCSYIRLYSDGTVLEVMRQSEIKKAELREWFRKGFSQSATYEINGSAIQFTIEGSADTVGYHGQIHGSMLSIDWVSRRGYNIGKEGHDTYELVQSGDGD